MSVGRERNGQHGLNVARKLPAAAAEHGRRFRELRIRAAMRGGTGGHVGRRASGMRRVTEGRGKARRDRHEDEGQGEEAVE